MLYAKQHAEFLTVTCLEWKHILQEDRFKDIITNSLTYLTSANRVTVYSFVIMSNHLGQQILKILRNENSPLQQELLINAKDRKHQVWERNSLGVPLWSPQVFNQKLEYIHNNPVKAGFCLYPEDYKYSSAKFYIKNENDWVFLTHYEG